MCVGMFANKLEGDFERYLTHFMPLLVNSLKTSDEYQVCSAAVGATGDICRAVEARWRRTATTSSCACSKRSRIRR